MMAPTTLLGRLLALATGVILLVAGFMASLVLLAIIFVLGAGFLAYFWWKIRPLRKAMEAQRRSDSGPTNGTVIDGESVVISEGAVTTVQQIGHDGDNPNQTIPSDSGNRHGT